MNDGGPILAELKDVTRIYGNGVAGLGPLSLTLRDGEFLSLLGPSGCGKSTALRVLAELLAPTSGDLVWPETRPRTGFVFQDATLMPWANARDNVRLPLDLEGVPRGSANAAAEATLARVGLADFAGAFPRALSGGMRMRVSIARALVSKPRLLLMDEPFAALDEMTREGLNADILKLWREDNLTIVFVTHSVIESVFLSTRIAMLTARPGRVAALFDIAPRALRDAEWRLSPHFAECARDVSRALRNTLSQAA